MSAVAMRAVKPAKNNAKILRLVRTAQKRWEALPAEEQWLHSLARKVHMVHSIRRSDDQTLEQSAHRALTSEVSAKFAEWILRKRKFRKILGLKAA